MSELILPQSESALREQTLIDYKKLSESIKRIPDEEIRKAVESYWKEHYLVMDFFTLVPEDKYGVRVADETPQGPSASTRDNLEHIIANLEARIIGIEQGELKWGAPDPTLKELSKAQLLKRLINDNYKIVELASDPNTVSRQVRTPFGLNTATQLVQGLVPHQILHQGIHLGLMDIMGMSRPRSYTERWG